ncbi:ABC transporter ATP-binding protein [Deferrisoma palaeochoriense]
MSEPILTLEGVHAHIGGHHILQGVSLEARPGRATVLLGRNGAGKTTTLRTIMGLVRASKGKIRLAGEGIERRRTFEIARLGVGYVPEAQAVLCHLTVEENFRLAMPRETEESARRLDTVFRLFPALKKYWRAKAGVLSGGQKQMVAIGRAFVTDHRLLLIDEPSKGLAPVVVDHLIESLRHMSEETTVILVEQNFHMARHVGTDYFILDAGRVVHGGRMEDLVNDHTVKKRYLGIG